MEISISGLIIVLLAAAYGARAGAPYVLGFFASIPFGATAIGKFGATTPLIYCVFAVPLALNLCFVPEQRLKLVRLIDTKWTPRLILLLCVYGIVGALALPRIFEGVTNVFTPIVTTEVLHPLMPVKGNLSQTAYFLLSSAMFFVFLVAFQSPGFSAIVRHGFLLMAALQAILGAIDLIGNLSGFGDVFVPIRTAAYEMHTDESINGFPRISGAYSETSLYTAGAMPALAYTLTYGRHTGSAVAFALSIVLLLLLIFSTSSTAYVGLAALAVMHLAVVFTSAARIGFKRQDILLAFAVLAAFTLIIAFMLQGVTLESVTQLISKMVFEKGNTESAEERFSWNSQAIQGFIDTAGFGIGLGSTRTSGILFAVLAQLGVIGSAMMVGLFAILLLGGRTRDLAAVDPKDFALVRGAQAAAIAGLVGLSISGPNADPTPLFFIALSAICHARTIRFAERTAARQVPQPPPPSPGTPFCCGDGRAMTKLRNHGARLPLISPIVGPV